MLTFALLITASLSAAAGGKSPIVDAMFVYRPLPDVEAANERTGGDGLELLLTAPAKVGDHFFVVVPQEKKVLGAVLRKTVENHVDYPGPIGHLFPDSPSETWSALRNGRFGAVLVVRGDVAPALDRIGAVNTDGKSRERLYASRVQSLLSGTVRSKLLRVRSLTAPDGRRWELVVAEPVDVSKREFGVWQSGAMFEREGERRLVLAESGLTDVVSVSDLDADGVLELVVQIGPSYVVRLFDGNRFLTHGRVLDVWEL